MTMSSAAAPAGVLDSAPGVSIAYHKTAGKSPGVVFLGGFMSDMTGAKALAVEAFCRAHGHAIVRFDYRGHGASSGQFVDGTISLWTQDALSVIDRLTEGPQILVGSSMGGWIALLAGLARPARVAGLALIAPAPDFVEDLVWARLPDEYKATLQRDGVVRVPSAYNAQGYAISQALIDDGRRLKTLDRPIPFAGPVRILHGMQDADVPWQRSLTLAERLTAGDVQATFIKDGDHRLSRDQDLALLTATLGGLLTRGEQRL